MPSFRTAYPKAHNRAVVSWLPVARRVPSGLHATATMKLVWPVRVRMVWPVAASHSVPCPVTRSGPGRSPKSPHTSRKSGPCSLRPQLQWTGFSATGPTSARRDTGFVGTIWRPQAGGAGRQKNLVLVVTDIASRDAIRKGRCTGFSYVGIDSKDEAWGRSSGSGPYFVTVTSPVRRSRANRNDPACCDRDRRVALEKQEDS
jgi:hypothetical protein